MFYLVYAVKPLSRQGGSSKQMGNYQKALRAAAEAQYHDARLPGPLYARIMWFHAEPVAEGQSTPDLDNIVKPILDALDTVAYSGDFSIARLACSRHLADDVVLDNTHVPHWCANKLASLLAGSEQHILYVEIGSTSRAPAVFGPVDGVG